MTDRSLNPSRALGLLVFCCFAATGFAEDPPAKKPSEDVVSAGGSGEDEKKSSASPTSTGAETDAADADASESPADPAEDPHFAALRRELRAHVEKVDALDYRAPDFPAGKDWINSPPLSFERELKGKVVVLDFWTYCCINCIHILPDLEALEAKYAGYPVAFVGVHSAKFENEKVSENIRAAVERYEIHHPVVNDDEMFLWRRLGVRSWPSLVVVGPKGNLLLMVAGEGNRLVIDAAIQAALEFYPPEAFRHEPLPAVKSAPLERDDSSLFYPGKLAVDGAKGRLYISDSNHHRIVVTDLDGEFIAAIGSGRRGLRDGTYAEATFFRPQGLALDGEHLYVADAENHALRRVDLDAERVETVVGNGTQGRDYSGGKTGADQPISTPWDVVVHERSVYIAMAGTHQIWIYDIPSGSCRNYSGTGREQNYNHSDRLEAAWAQPSGLTIGDGWLFVADSESSSVRGIQLASGNTRTFVGGDDSEPRNLFAFGDEDGEGDSARLQHCLGVLWLEEERRVLVADTYNHRLKLVRPLDRTVRTVAGSGSRGTKDGRGLAAEFSEPSGFALHPDGKRVYVADTNNHRIRLLDRTTFEVTTLELRNVPPAKPAIDRASVRLANLPGTPTVRAETLELRPKGRGTLRLELGLPPEHHYTEGVQSSWKVLVDSEAAPVTIPSDAMRGALGATSIAIPVDAKAESGAGTIQVEAVAYYCRDGGACLVGAVLFEVPVVVDERSGEPLVLRHVFGEGVGTNIPALFRGSGEPAPAVEPSEPETSSDSREESDAPANANGSPTPKVDETERDSLNETAGPDAETAGSDETSTRTGKGSE